MAKEVKRLLYLGKNVQGVELEKLLEGRRGIVKVSGRVCLPQGNDVFVMTEVYKRDSGGRAGKPLYLTINIGKQTQQNT